MGFKGRNSARAGCTDRLYSRWYVLASSSSITSLRLPTLPEHSPGPSQLCRNLFAGQDGHTRSFLLSGVCKCDACIALQEIHYDAPARTCILSGVVVDGWPIHPEENEDVFQVGKEDPRPEISRLEVQCDQRHACLHNVLPGDLHSMHTMTQTQPKLSAGKHTSLIHHAGMQYYAWLV